MTRDSAASGTGDHLTLLAPREWAPAFRPRFRLACGPVTVEINEITGVAGYLAPGCHVDVIQTLRDDKTGFPTARTLAQNVKITAIGVRHNPQDGDGGGRSITLLVTPPQAELMELVQLARPSPLLASQWKRSRRWLRPRALPLRS